MTQDRRKNLSGRVLPSSDSRGRSASQTEDRIEVVVVDERSIWPVDSCRLDRKFFGEKVASPFEFVTGPSEIRVFSKESEQEVFWSDHANGDNALIR